MKYSDRWCMIEGFPRRTRVNQIDINKEDIQPKCHKCGHTGIRWIRDILQHGFWETDITSYGQCTCGQYLAYHYVVVNEFEVIKGASK